MPHGAKITGGGAASASGQTSEDGGQVASGIVGGQAPEAADLVSYWEIPKTVPIMNESLGMDEVFSLLVDDNHGCSSLENDASHVATFKFEATMKTLVQQRDAQRAETQEAGIQKALQKCRKNDCRGSRSRSRSRSQSTNQSRSIILPAEEEVQHKLHEELTRQHGQKIKELQMAPWNQWINMSHLQSKLEKDKEEQYQRVASLLKRLIDDTPGQYYIGISFDPIGRYLGIKRYGPEKGKRFKAHIDSWQTMVLLAWQEGPWIAEMERKAVPVKAGVAKTAKPVQPQCANRKPGGGGTSPKGTWGTLYFCRDETSHAYDSLGKHELISLALDYAKLFPL